MDTGLKRTLKEEFVVCYVGSDMKRHYTYSLNSSPNTTEDIDDAMKLKTLDQAKALALLCESTSSYFKNGNCKIVRVATIVEDIDDTYSAESE